MSLSMIEASAKSSTLHEVIMAEKMDFEAKLERMARRKQWLKAHQQLLRTLLSYSVLHGSCGGGLASVRMELILLLQVCTTFKYFSPKPLYMSGHPAKYNFLFISTNIYICIHIESTYV